MPPSASALTDAAADAAGRGDLDSALDLVRRALNVAPNHLPALICLGNVLADGGDTDGAAAAYQLALTAAPQSFEAHANAGLLASEMGRRDAAIKHLRAGVAINPGWADGCYNLANLLGSTDATTAAKLEAVQLYERALELGAADDADVLCNLADVLSDLALYDKGVRAAARAVAAHPAHAGAAKRHALLLMQMGRHSEALNAARAAAARDRAAGREDHETHALLAEAPQCGWTGPVRTPQPGRACMAEGLPWQVDPSERCDDSVASSSPAGVAPVGRAARRGGTAAGGEPRGAHAAAAPPLLGTPLPVHAPRWSASTHPSLRGLRCACMRCSLRWEKGPPPARCAATGA